MKTIIPMLLCASALSAAQPTVTAVVRSPFGGPELERFTNVVAVVWNHEKREPPCHLIRYVKDGKTNEFHAWMVNVTVTTNKATRK